MKVLDTGNPPTELEDGIPLPVASGATSASAIVNVLNDGEDTITFGLQADMEDLKGSVSAATGPATDRFTLKADELAAVKVTVENVTDNGEHKGKLLVAGEGQGLSALIDIRVQRSDSTSDLLVEGSSADGITRTVSGAAFRDTITLLSPGEDPLDVAWRLTDLSGPGNETYDLEAIHAAAQVPAQFSVSTPYDITLSAQLPRPGEYRATVTMTVDDTSTSVAILLTRTAEALALTVAEPAVPSVTAAESANTTLTVEVSSGSPVDLRRPTIRGNVARTTSRSKPW